MFAGIGRDSRRQRGQSLCDNVVSFAGSVVFECFVFENCFYWVVGRDFSFGDEMPMGSSCGVEFFPAFGEVVEGFLQVRDFHDPQNSAIDRALFLLLLPTIFRRGSFEFAWVIGLGIIPAITDFFLSYTRFVTMTILVLSF